MTTQQQNQMNYKSLLEYIESKHPMTTPTKTTTTADAGQNREPKPLGGTCSICGTENDIVNQCRCDPNNLPTRVPIEHTREQGHSALRVKGGKFEKFDPNPAPAKPAHTPDFKKMALDVATAWDSEGAHTNVRLLKQIAAQLHAAYVLGETDADRRAGRVLDSIAAAPETAAERDRLRELVVAITNQRDDVIHERDKARGQVKALQQVLLRVQHADAFTTLPIGLRNAVMDAINSIESEVGQ